MEKKSDFYNRIVKNYKKLKKWIESEGIEAYRIYDKEIPQYPYIVDIYKDHALIYEKGKAITEDMLGTQAKHQGEVYQSIKEILGISEANIIFKRRMVQKGKEQYEKMYEEKSERIIIKENKLLFHVNLFDYLDTGLFFDYRRLRADFLKNLKSKKFLNLYAYTGAFSVVAAKTGAHVTTVDLSNTYLNWAKDNFRLNHMVFSHHNFVHKDVFAYLKDCEEKFDTIFCDPPSFSNSKSFDGAFDVQRDHDGLVRICMKNLERGGTLYFSNNLKKFKIDEKLKAEYNIRDITEKTIPKDFVNKKVHHCFQITFKED